MKQTTKRVLMIDFETYDTQPTAYVLQVGYAVVDFIITRHGVMETTVDRNIVLPAQTYHIGDQENRTFDFNTIAWWHGQAEAVRRRVLGSEHNPTISTGFLHNDLAGWVRPSEAGPVEVWAKPAAFDLPLAKSLFGGSVPWHYRQERCLATLIREIDPDLALAPPDNGMAHDAGADVEWQLDYLHNLLHFIHQRSAP